MENQSVYHVLPDTATGVLEMFNTSKEGIILFASKVINEVESGNIDPLKAKIWAKTLESIAEKIDKGTIEYQKTQAAKYGEKPFAFSGAELHYTATYTAYDYTICNDLVLNAMEENLTRLKQQIEQRKEFLKTLGGPQNLLNDETGEVNTIYPPMKKSTMGVKCTIK